MKTYTFNKSYCVMQPANELDGEYCLTDEVMERIDTLKDALKDVTEYLETDGHSCEFTYNPEAGKCDFCEMMADLKMVIYEYK